MNKNWLEWGVFGVSLLCILAVLGALVVDGLQPGESRAEIVLEVGQPEPMGSSFRVPIIARNRGKETAEGVQIEVVLKPGSAKGEEETSTFELPYLPRESVREGWAVFSDDPSQGELEARVVGYQRP